MIKKAAVKSWSTTLLGLVGAVGVLATAVHAHFDADPATVADWATAIPTALGLLGIGTFARDHGVSSEEAGVASPTE